MRQVHAEALAVDQQAGVGLAAEEVEVLLRGVLAAELGDRVDVLAARDQLGADGHAARRLDLVARQHPDLDAGVAEELERGLDVLLELVLDARDAEQLHVVLEVAGHDGLHARLAAADGEGCFLIPGRELVVLGRREPLPADHERPETLTRHVRRFLVQPVICGDDGPHDGVGALLVEPNLPTAQAGDARLQFLVKLHNDTHPLAFRGEGEDVENPDLDGGPARLGRLEEHALAVSRGQAQTDRLGPPHDGNLVGRAGLVRRHHPAVLVLFGGRRHVVAERQGKHDIADAGSDLPACSGRSDIGGRRDRGGRSRERPVAGCGRQVEALLHVRRDLVHGVVGVRHGADVDLSHVHFVLGQGPRLVAEQVLDPAQVLGDGAGPHHRARHARVSLDKPRIDALAHVEVHPQADGHDGREEDQEPHDLDVPDAPLGVAEAFQGDQDDGDGEREEAEDLGERVDLVFQETRLGTRRRRGQRRTGLRARVNYDGQRGGVRGNDGIRPCRVVDRERRRVCEAVVVAGNRGCIRSISPRGQEFQGANKLVDLLIGLATGDSETD